MATKKKATAGAPPDADEVIATLEGKASKSVRDGMARYGIPNDHALGISVGALRALGKKLGKHHGLALALWKSGIYEARMLASFVGEADKLTAAEMDRFCRDFDNWAIADTMAFALFDRSPHAFAKVKAWSTKKPEFEKRAASDERNFVKKGVSWALRSIGGRNLALCEASLKLARKLAESGGATERWIGKDALRDLTRPVVQKKLKARGRG